MVCPTCQHDNAASAKFCAECGAALARVCSACRASNTPTARFCNECGSSFAAESSGIRRAEHAERRQLTVVFCDLVSYTELAARMDPEDLREIVAAFQEVATAAVKVHDGHVAQHLGDGLMIYFGYPRAHEDDPVRSVHAALGVLAAVRSLGERLDRERGFRLSARVGIHTGPTVVGAIGAGASEEQLAVGEAPNLAARLQSIAAPDTIVISAETARLVRRAFSLEDLGTVALKGFGDQRHVHRVVSARRLFGSDNPDATTTPFVGRESEVSALRTLWEQARSGTGRSVIVRGEAGVGKSRLCRVVSGWIAQAGGRELRAACSPYFTHSAMRPVIELVNQLAGINDDDTPETKRDALERAVAADGGPAADAVALLAGLVGVPPDDVRWPTPAITPQVRKQRTIAVVVRMLLGAARREPLTITVEDLHWVDQSTLEVLGALIEQAPMSPLLLVMTCRQQFEAPWQVDSEIALHRLPREAVERIVQHTVDGRALPAEVIQQILLKADGNPLFVEELTRMVVESGLLVDGEGGLKAAVAPLPPIAIPATLHDSLMARLDRLSPPRKALVQLCATIGRQFSYELLHEIVSSFEEEMRNELRRLTDGELLYQRGVPPRSVFVFRHALIQDAAYGSLLRRTRTRYHARVADVLLSRFPDTPPEVIANHLTEAGRPAEAIEHWRAAGQAALGAFALTDAAAHLYRGLGLCEQLPPGPRAYEAELGVRGLLGVILMLTQGFASPEVETNAQRMLALCETHPSPAAEFPALWGLWTVAIVSGNHTRAQAMGERLGALAARTQDSAIELAARTSTGAALLMRGKVVEAQQAFEAGLAIYDRAAHAPLAMLFGQDAGAMCAAFLTWVHACDGDAERARVRAAEAVRMCDELGQPSTRAFVGTVLATWCCVAGAFDEAEGHAAEVIRLAAEQGMPHWDAQASITRGWALAGRGRAREGSELIRRSIAMLTGIGSFASMSFYWAGQAEADLAAGDLDGARAAIADALRYVDRSDERIHEPALRALAARVEHAGLN
ncbi:MAG TPA: AAA family ATPase [Kofleriaceae bacterium]|nr:AAA family ATPase [Kofleriaceae bacterium]